MAHGLDKYQSRANRARVRDLFRREWDPIGIVGGDGDDEYDPYADKAYVMLMDEEASDTTIAAYLFKIASEHMGLSDHKRIAERSNHVAKLLVGLRPQF
jgi:hypothetical protein